MVVVLNIRILLKINHLLKVLLFANKYKDSPNTIKKAL